MKKHIIIHLLERQKCLLSDPQKQTMTLVWCSQGISGIIAQRTNMGYFISNNYLFLLPVNL